MIGAADHVLGETPARAEQQQQRTLGVADHSTERRVGERRLARTSRGDEQHRRRATLLLDVDDRPVIQLDIHPTALAAAGVEIKPEWKLDGVNLLPFLTGEKPQPPHAALYWRFGGQIAIRQSDWKLVKGPGGSAGPGALRGSANTEGAELYNLTEDVGEKNNRAAQEPGKVKELAAAWNQATGRRSKPH